jgi:hypothetical protein
MEVARGVPYYKRLQRLRTTRFREKELLAIGRRFHHNPLQSFRLPAACREDLAMFRLLGLVPLLLLLVAVPSRGEDEAAALHKAIQTVAQQGRGTPQGRAAWDRVAAAPPAVLVPLLEAMDTRDTVAANWLRTAFDRIVERTLQAGGKGIDAEGLLTFVRDSRRQGRPRRLALEVVEQLRPGVSATLYPSWLDDPEFRHEAVSLVLKEAETLARQGAREKAVAAYRKAFEASRDIPQGRAAAAGLLALGVTVSVAEHLGFLLDWYVIGPFDGLGMKGFHTLTRRKQTSI